MLDNRVTAEGRRRFSRSIKESFYHAWEGLSYTYKTQRNMRIHLVIAALVVGVSIAFGLSVEGFFMIFLAIAVVLLSEVVNTLSESIVDLIEPNYSLLAKRIKDVAAGGVLLGAAFSVIIGVLAFCPVLTDLPGRFAAFASYLWKYVLVYSFCVILPAILGLLRCKDIPGSKDLDRDVDMGSSRENPQQEESSAYNHRTRSFG